MADLTGVNDTLPVRIGGVSSSSGLPDNYADVNSSGSLQVAGQGVAGTPAGGVVSIQGVSGGTAVPVSQFTSPWVTKDQSDGPVTPGTVATFSQLIGGQYNTALPTLTTGQQSAIQLDANGRIYTNVASTAPPNNITSTGTLTGTGQSVNLTLQGTASVNVDVSGPGFVGTIVVIENTPSQSRVLGVFNGNYSAIASSITANGNYRVVGIATSSTITVQFSAYTSGSATVNIYGSTAPFIIMPYSANAANVLVTSYLNDGVGNALNSSSGSLLVKDNADGPVSPGAVASNSILIGGQFNSTLPTLTNTQQSAVQIDSSGRIITAPITISSPVANKAGVYAMISNNALSIQPSFGTLFYDSFDSATGLDTANRWTLTTASGGSESIALGVCTLSVTTAASSQVLLSSQPSFTPSFSSLVFGTEVVTGLTPPTGAHTFWGLGNQPNTFTAATPLLNAIGFEIDTSGNLNAVVYSNGTKTQNTTLNSYLSASQQIFLVYLNGQTASFYIQSSGFEVPVAAYVGITLDNFILPIRLHVINGTTSPATARTLPISATGLGDTNPNAATQLSDGTYAWRKATVNSDGSMNHRVYDGSGNAISSYNSQLDTADVINTGLSSGSITVGTTAVAARVGASNLANRKMLMISPVTYIVYMGATSAVTTATGIPIYPGQIVSFAFSTNVTPYLIAATSGTVNIFEAS